MKKNRTVGHFRLERENVGDRAMGWEGKEGKEQGVARREGGIQQDFWGEKREQRVWSKELKRGNRGRGLRNGIFREEKSNKAQLAKVEKRKKGVAKGQAKRSIKSSKQCDIVTRTRLNPLKRPPGNFYKLKPLNYCIHDPWCTCLFKNRNSFVDSFLSLFSNRFFSHELEIGNFS